jgi:hypothetical protein
LAIDKFIHRQLDSYFTCVIYCVTFYLSKKLQCCLNLFSKNLNFLQELMLIVFTGPSWSFYSSNIPGSVLLRIEKHNYHFTWNIFPHSHSWQYLSFQNTAEITLHRENVSCHQILFTICPCLFFVCSIYKNLIFSLLFIFLAIRDLNIISWENNFLRSWKRAFSYEGAHQTIMCRLFNKNAMRQVMNGYKNNKECKPN